MRHSRQRTRRSSASAARDGPSTSRLSPTQPASQGPGSIASQRSASSSPSCERCRRGRLRALLCGRAPTRYANASTPPETRSPVFAPRTTRCATSSLVISELNACSLSASGRADHDDIDEPLRMLPAVTCLRCKTESLQGIPDPGLVITVVIGGSGVTGGGRRGHQIRSVRVSASRATRVMMLVVVVIVAACSSSRPAIRVAPSASSSTIPQAAFCGLYRRDAPETGHHAHPLLPRDSTAVSFPGRGTGGAWIRRACARVRSRHLGNRHHCFTSSRRHVDHYACVGRRERHDRFDRRLDRWSITRGPLLAEGCPQGWTRRAASRRAHRYRRRAQGIHATTRRVDDL